MGASLSFPEEEINPERTYLITGANSGIGYEAAKTIAGLGAHVIIACRNVTKADSAVQQMQEEYNKDFILKMEKELEANRRDPRKLNIEIMELDLVSFASTKRFIEAFKARNCKLNVLVCNAGIAVKAKEITEDGYELMLQANYLSHLLIILHFLPILMESGEDSRIVRTSSVAHTVGKFNTANINAEQSWGEITFYSNSKLYQIMSMLWLIRNIKSTQVTISSCHPGIVDTQMTQTSDLFFCSWRKLLPGHYMSNCSLYHPDPLCLCKLRQNRAWTGKLSILIGSKSTSGHHKVKVELPCVHFGPKPTWTNANLYQYGHIFNKGRNAIEGAATIIKAAIDTTLQGQTGIYMSDCKIKTPSSLARDPVKQDELMKWSLENLKPHLPDNLSEILNYEQ